MRIQKISRTVFHLILALVLVLFILSFAVVMTLNFRPLYYFDIGFLNISETSGYAESEIRANYDALIDYNLLTGPQTLTFPTLTMSESGRIHFEEVKAIFITIQILAIVTLPLSVIGIIIALRQKDAHYLKYAAILAVALPAVLGFLIALNWDSFFVTFHKIFFNNDYWIFYADTDPVITILPDAFFMHCAILILLLVVAGSIICGLSYRHLHRKYTSAQMPQKQTHCPDA